MSHVRRGRERDEPALRALQGYLREPSPKLLAHGLRTGDVLVSVAGDGSDGGPTGRRVPAHEGPTGGESTHEGPTGGESTDGRPVGYVLPVSGGGADADVHVAELVVHPEHRREGRAAALLERVLEDATGTVTLFVAPDNEPALALYRQFGFEVADRKSGFYDDGDALVMARDPSRE